MISATNGHDIAMKNALRSKWDISEFKGKVENLKQGHTSDKNKLFNSDAVVSRGSNLKSEEVIEKVKRARQATQDQANARKFIQQPILDDFIDGFNNRNRWAILIKEIGGGVTSSQLINTAKGSSTIKDVELWAKIEDGIKRILARNSVA